MEIESQKAGAIPVGALAEMLGMSPQQSIKTTRDSPVRVEKHAVLVDPNELLGTAQGRVTEAITTNKGLTLRYGDVKK